MVKVADECWLALALLTREHPERQSFSTREILTKIRHEQIHPELRAGVPAHIHQHNVANCAPSTARYRMFYRLPDGTFRLYRTGDTTDPDRAGKTHPARTDLPAKYHFLLDWYESESRSVLGAVAAEEDPILSLRGLGKEIWAGVDPDVYVNDLRSDWDGKDFPALPPSGQSGDANEIWTRILRHQGAEFKTKNHLPFTYRVEGDSGIWFVRSGHVVPRRLWKGEIEAALRKCPLTKTTDLQEFQCSSYLFGLLTDSRILGPAESGSRGGATSG
ncbi:MAG TPA: hypothetical protein VKE70_12690 [Candidatus Solibacter sp.]|nr:hypothetical protein [Candidatus Solibacter sp.]